MKIFKNNVLATKVFVFIKNKFFYTVPIRVTMELFLSITIVSILGVINQDFNSPANAISSLFSILSFIAFIFIPIGIFYLIINKRD